MTDTAPQQLRPERTGKKGVMTYLPDEMAIRLKVIAAQEGTTIQKIGHIAFSNWLMLHKMRPEMALDPDLLKGAEPDIPLKRKQGQEAKTSLQTTAVIRGDKQLKKPSKTTGQSLH